MNLWEKYKNEREGLKTIAEEHGFVTYKISNSTCLVSDIFVDKEYRNSSLFFKLARKIESIAKKEKCTLLEAQVWCNTSNPTLSLKAILSYGFRLIGAENNVIFLVKEI